MAKKKEPVPVSPESEIFAEVDSAITVQPVQEEDVGAIPVETPVSVRDDPPTPPAPPEQTTTAEEPAAPQAEDADQETQQPNPTAPPKTTPAKPQKKQTPRMEYATPEEEQEWNAIYASLRSRSLLAGTVLGVDKNTFEMTDRVSGETQIKEVFSVVIVQHRVKIIIPETELWMPGEEWPIQVLRNMVGSKLEYVILEVDAENQCAVASRRIAMAVRRRYFRTAPRGHAPGKEIVSANILAVGPRRCLVEFSGYDVDLRPGQISYAAIADLRTHYHAGEELRCLLTGYDAESDRLEISAKLATTNPFDGAEQRHPVGSRRQAKITGKYNGGVFVTLADDVTCLCDYSQILSDGNFSIGDNVIIVIQRYNNVRKLIDGRILRKW